MHNLCKYLPRNDYYVITVREDFALNRGSYDKDFILDCNTIRLPVSTDNLRDRVMFLLFTIFKGFFLNIKIDVKCILAVYPAEFDLYAAYFLSLFTGKPLIIYMHDLYSEVRREGRLFRILKFVETTIFSSASVILVTNEKFKEHYSKRGINNVKVFHSCVDLNMNNAQPLSQSNRDAEQRLKIVFTGSVYQYNEDAITCFLKATKKISNIELIFSTPSKKDYLKEVSIGFLPKKECFKLQRDADICFLPLSFNYSIPEEIRIAFPTKLLEYLSATKPILAIVPEGSFMEEFIIKYGVGIVINELSEQKIIEAIEYLKNDEKRKKFSNNSLKTVKRFDARIQARKFQCLMRSVVLNDARKEHARVRV